MDKPKTYFTVELPHDCYVTLTQVLIAAIRKEEMTPCLDQDEHISRLGKLQVCINQIEIGLMAPLRKTT